MRLCVLSLDPEAGAGQQPAMAFIGQYWPFAVVPYLGKGVERIAGILRTDDNEYVLRDASLHQPPARD